LGDFTKNSTIHGVKYLGDRRRHWIEQIFWILAFSASISGCTLMILNIYNKWQLNPVIINVGEHLEPVWQIPFPAVTICPETKVLKKHVDFTKGYLAAISKIDTGNFTNSQMKSLEALAQVCSPQLFTMQNLSFESGIKHDEIIAQLQNISLRMMESTIFCKWNNDVYACDHLLTEIITEEGVCYTFNVLNSSDFFREEK
jgi:acid-sensing ion channel, other